MINSEKHVLRVSVEVKQVHLSVKFPCSLKFSLNSDRGIANGKTMFEHKKGVTCPCEVLTTDVYVEFQDRAYVAEQIHLYLFLVSSRGEIPAGNVLILIPSSNLGEKVEITKTISKCPDHTGKVHLAIITQFVQVLQGFDKIQEFEEEQRSLKSKRSQRMQRSQRSPFQELKPGRVNFSSTDQFFARTSSQTHQRIGHQRKTMIQKKSTFIGKSPLGIKKQSQGEGEKNNFSRTQIINFQHMKERILDSKSNFTREEIGILYQNLKSQKQKNVTLQKRERQLLDQKNRLQEQLNRKQQLKGIELDTSFISENKKKQMLNLQKHIQSQNVQINELKIDINSLEKRNQQQKEHSNQQYNQLLKKYQKSEKQRTDAMIEMNGKLTKIQQIEKKYQAALKEKEKKFNEQKKQREKQISRLELKCQEIEGKLEKNNVLNQRQLSSKIKDFENMIGLMKNENYLLSTELQKQIIQKKKLKNDLEQNQLLLENKEKQMFEQSQQMKKILEEGKQNKNLSIDLNSQLIEAHKQIYSLQNENEILNKKVEDMNQQIIDIKQKYSQLSQKYSHQKEELEKGFQQRKIRQQEVKKYEKLIEEQKKQNEQLRFQLLHREKEISKYENDLKQNQDNLQQLIEEIQKIKQTKVSLEKQRLQLFRKTQKQEENFNSLKNSHRIHQQNQQKLNKLITSNENEKITIMLQNTTLKNKIKVFRENLLEITSFNENICLSSKNLEELIGGIKQKIKYFTQNTSQFLIEKTNEVDDEHQVRLQKAQLEDLLRELQQRKKQIIALETQNIKYEKQIASLVSQHKIQNQEKFASENSEPNQLQLKEKISSQKSNSPDVYQEKRKQNKLIDKTQWLLEQNKRITDELQFLRNQFIKQMEGTIEVGHELLYERSRKFVKEKELFNQKVEDKKQQKLIEALTSILNSINLSERVLIQSEMIEEKIKFYLVNLKREMENIAQIS